MTKLKELECFVFDMDGTVYLGEEVIPGAIELLDEIEHQGKRFFFFTNNSSKSPMSYVEKLIRLGFHDIGRDKILTSGDVMIDFLKKLYPAPKIYLSGTPSLMEQFEASGIILVPEGEYDVDACVLGFDTTFDFKKADNICKLVTKGIPFYATNIDRVCPLEGGAFIPDCGSMSKMIEHATGKGPKFVGKPFKETIDYVLSYTGLSRDKVCIVGDRLYTDIATGNNGGITSIGVLSGEMTLEDIESQDEIHVDILYDSVMDMLEELRNE